MQCCVITNEGSLKCWHVEDNMNPSVVTGLTSGVKSVGVGQVCSILCPQFFALFWHSFVCGVLWLEIVLILFRS
jgi:hypothetical protein